ncbi:unnamed protein product [Allacma fusca]|uniref:Protein kintoun n=1 Tax=Allacma fusca TaxID=39272 RepID=A0A8J2NTT5_9HEXA|nr:unnamed protein product [Allacma fusca]
MSRHHAKREGVNMEAVSQDCVGEEIPPGLIYPPQTDKEDFQITRDELEQLQQALKSEKFRSMLNDYAEEVQDPKNRTLFQSELRQLEKQNGNKVHFINPIAGYVLKTSANGDKKAFINMCSNPMIRKLSFQKATQENVDGTMCSIPFAQSPGREDVDKAGRYCDVYDVVFHPNTLALCDVDERIRQQVEATALDAIESSFNLKLDRNNIRRPKLKYKGMKHATMIKYKASGDLPKVLDPDQIQNEPPPQPQEAYYQKKDNSTTEKRNNFKKKPQAKIPSNLENADIENVKPHNPKSKSTEWTEPKYSLKFRSHVDLQDFCLDNQREGRSIKSIPEEIVLTIDLPLLKDSSTLEADVLEGGWDFELKAERRAYYRLNLKLPFQVHCDQSKASFDVDKRKLVVVMKTVQKANAGVDFKPSSVDSSNEIKPLQELESNVSRRSDEEDKVENFSSESESFSDSPSPPPQPGPEGNFLKKAVQDEKKEPKVIELSQPQSVPQWINGDIVVKSILKRSARSRSMSESWLDDRSPSEEDFMSLESLNENEEAVLGTSPFNKDKSVRFNEAIQRQLYRSNSSIFGQRKKNQRKSRNKRKARGRLNSEGSVSSMDEEDFAGFSRNHDNDGGDSAVCDCESDEKDAKLAD